MGTVGQVGPTRSVRLRLRYHGKKANNRRRTRQQLASDPRALLPLSRPGGRAGARAFSRQQPQGKSKSKSLPIWRPSRSSNILSTAVTRLGKGSKPPVTEKVR